MPSSPSARRVAGILCGLAVALCASSTPRAHDRVYRLFDQRDGLPAGEVVRLAQDTRGFVWLGSFAGLVRYDGQEMRPWAPERLNGHVSVLITGPDGEVVVRVEPGRAGGLDGSTLYRVVSGGVEPVSGPEGRPLSGIGDAAYGGSGMLCAVQDGDVLCRQPAGAWVRHQLDAGTLERAERLEAGPEGSVLAMTAEGLWRLDADGAVRRLAAIAGLRGAVAGPGDTYAALTFDATGTGRLITIAGGETTTVATLEARPIALVRRRDVVWATFDRFVVAARPGEPPEILGREDDLPSGGPLLVDREGGLWLGTYHGVMYLPEPETVVWNERDGLISGHTRFIGVAGASMWIGTWQGLARLERGAAGWRVHPRAAPGRDRMCVDGRGRLWMANLGRGLVRHEPAGHTLFADARMQNWLGCSRREDGTVWLATSTGIYRTPRGEGAPVPVAPGPADPVDVPSFRQILEDRDGRLWVSANDQICHAEAAGLPDADWTCERIPDARGISALVELDDGDLWLATDRVGVWRYAGESWMQVPATARLPSYSLRGLVRSADGTIWILGHGTVVRVRDDHETPEGWRVVERLGGLHGLPSAAAEDLYEAEDGSVWITTIVGLVHVPPRARQTTLQPPAVELVDTVVNGERRVGPGPLRLGASDALELRFAALSYRDRGLLRHQYRLHPGARWTTSAGEPSTFQFPDLAPGRYTIEVRASLDGMAWTPAPAALSFEILPPWYGRTWALLVFASTALLALYAVYRLRVAFLLRLERHRTRLAMDLHDEIGAGLGSINILSGLAAERTPAGSAPAGLLQEISETTAELGASLGEIVWSLRSRSETLDGLMSHLSERAARLFPGDTPRLQIAVPDALPAITLPLALRWNVSLIAIEALHNAARHAAATVVTLGLEPAGSRWRLLVSDDGRGRTGDRAGVGLESMRRRAGEIGGVLDIAANDAGGMTVSLLFDPREAGARR